MCEHGITSTILVPVHGDDAYEHTLLWKRKPVDFCLVSLVKALNSSGLLTRSCCCGHGKRPGSIVLHSGRTLVIFDTPQEAADAETYAAHQLHRSRVEQ